MNACQTGKEILHKKSFHFFSLLALPRARPLTTFNQFNTNIYQELLGGGGEHLRKLFRFISDERFVRRIANRFRRMF
jgi:hypothetical protein